jgi:hypothetical protein
MDLFADLEENLGHKKTLIHKNQGFKIGVSRTFGITLP